MAVSVGMLLREDALCRAGASVTSRLSALKVKLGAVVVQEAHAGQRTRLEPGEVATERMGVAEGLTVVDVVNLEEGRILIHCDIHEDLKD